MTIAIDPKTLGPNGLPILTLKHKPPGASQEVSVLPKDPEPTPAAQPNSKVRKAIARAKAGREQLDWLRVTFPKAFNFNFSPLTLDTRKRVIAAAEEAGRDSRTVVEGVKQHCGHPRYVWNLSQPAAVRIDLEGNPAESVSDDHRAHAIECLKAVKVKITQRKKQHPSA